MSVTFVSNSGDKFEVSEANAKKMETSRLLLEEVGEAAGQEMPVNEVTSETLRLVLKYAENEEDPDFFKLSNPVLFELILAANYLGYQTLLDASCKTVANMIKGKTPEEIRTHFNIKNDFTPEEMERVKQENEWVEEK